MILRKMSLMALFVVLIGSTPTVTLAQDKSTYKRTPYVTGGRQVDEVRQPELTEIPYITSGRQVDEVLVKVSQETLYIKVGRQVDEVLVTTRSIGDGMLRVSMTSKNDKFVIVIPEDDDKNPDVAYNIKSIGALWAGAKSLLATIAGACGFGGDGSSGDSSGDSDSSSNDSSSNDSSSNDSSSNDGDVDQGGEGNTNLNGTYNSGGGDIIINHNCTPA